MGENELLKELEIYKGKYGEKDKVEAFFSFLKQNGKKSFFRTLDTGHITASGWLVSEDFKKVLLISHKKLKKLIQPGGHCEENDNSVKMTALRELKEETGLQDIRLLNDEIFYIDIHEIGSENKVHYHYDMCYLFICDDKQQVTASDESDEIGWYDLDQIAHMEDMDKGVFEMAERVKYSKQFGIEKN